MTSLGRVVADETRLSDVTPKLEGWVETLHVNFTGAPVQAGQPLFDLYSPILVAAQEELILAARLLARAEPGTDREENSRTLLESVRRRLRYWDVPKDVIDHIEYTGEVQRTVPILAPTSGVVLEKSVVEGARVTPSTRLFRIADLSWIWIETDVFERDLSLISNGQHGLISLEAYPGESFHGQVTFVYPTLDPVTRTGMVRVELGNPDLRLRPGMFATLEFSLPTEHPVLVIPRGAVLATGERTLVFVREPDGTLVPREVVAGLSAGNDVEILSGVVEGESVVSSASFLVDAESNLGSAAMNLGVAGAVGPGQADRSGQTAEPVDHSQHQMDTMPADSTGGGTAAVDHSGHQMPTAPETGDSAGAHSGHTAPQG